MYQYQPLPPISKTGRTPPGWLEVADVTTAPPYEALSYTWGSDDPTDYIWIQGNPLPIKPNLAAALHSLRLTTSGRRLWIDALCIDQSNLEERSRQVSYMRLVYKHATRVIAWLGVHTPDAEVAFEVTRRLADVERFH
ncbi:heterokaryon incompatibility protein-domain-containing protein [Corynascus novoguineensis]|uniref:Heterokaryon incompatibility protein-domain-containing protein n=1 Tax=Corynascus novoguineensis TaxID=1126955 RepID=A0AAN7CMJ9_9PEZI|nr:heterokaryon incompatibility protein-domain-containing protein [Corynascus novoguineensis]